MRLVFDSVPQIMRLFLFFNFIFKMETNTIDTPSDIFWKLFDETELMIINELDNYEKDLDQFSNNPRYRAVLARDFEPSINEAKEKLEYLRGVRKVFEVSFLSIPPEMLDDIPVDSDQFYRFITDLNGYIEKGEFPGKENESVLRDESPSLSRGQQFISSVRGGINRLTMNVQLMSVIRS